MFTNCPLDTLEAEPYGPTNMDAILISDNSGADQDSLRITVEPAGYTPQTLIPNLGKDTLMEVKYTAADNAGNSAECSFSIKTIGISQTINH